MPSTFIEFPAGRWLARCRQARAMAAFARSKLRKASPSIRAAGRARNAFYLDAWQRAARQCGAECIELAGSILELRRDGTRRYVFRNYTALDDPVTLRVAGHKGIVQSKLEAAALPVSPHRRFRLDTLADAEAFCHEAGTPCVVKPLTNSSAGAGVVTGIDNRKSLVAAAIAASGEDAELLIERQVDGQNLRLLYLDGELIDAVRRDPPSVIGDGRSTLRQLIGENNRRRLEQGYALAQVQLAIDDDVRRTLHRQGLHLGSVPGDRQVIQVKTVVNNNAAPENHAVMAQIGPALAAEGRRAAEAIGVRWAGVDVLTPDPTRSLREAGGVVLEVNTTPGFYLHYHRQGTPVPVAEYALERMFAGAKLTDGAS